MPELLEIERLRRDETPSRVVHLSFCGDVFEVAVEQHPDGVWHAVEVSPRPATVTDDALLRLEAMSALND